MPPARVSAFSDEVLIELTVEEEDCGSQERKYWLFQGTNERH